MLIVMRLFLNFIHIIEEKNMNTASNHSLWAIGSGAEEASTGFTPNNQSEHISSGLNFASISHPKMDGLSYEHQRRFRSLRDYVNALFSQHARLIVIRLDLKYTGEFIPYTSIEQAQEDISHLFANTRHNALFDDLAGYVWKLEESSQEGYHYHLILFFTNAHKQNDGYYGEAIGQYWQNVITQGRGCYFNCNRSEYKGQQSDLAIGRIEHSDAQKRYDLLGILAYFCKEEQALQQKLPRIRTIRRGDFPEEVKEKLGRPRGKSILHNL